MSQLLFSKHWNPEEAGSNGSKGMDLPAKSEGKQAKGKELPSSLSFIKAATRRCGLDLGWVFLPQMIQVTKKNPSHVCPEAQALS